MTGGWGFVQRSLSIFYTENLINQFSTQPEALWNYQRFPNLDTFILFYYYFLFIYFNLNLEQTGA
jgi:hypothetical protein